MRNFLALLPLVAFVLWLVGFRRSAAMAGIWSAALCAALAVGAFDYPVDASSVLGPLAEALFACATIVWIIFPALGIYEFQKDTGATQTIGRWLAGVSGKPQVQALLIAWFFGLFLESAAGFGAAIGNIITPHNIVAGAATVGAVGRKGEVLRQTLPVCAIYAAVGGLLLFALGHLL
ncbi:L-lactate permease [Erythrobacter sp.]|uniref:L-lactate permease n=1 Tax=Erythrobacter sp. TaxID=1042 RepID=UPI001425C489|nr:L-lactate permease [Erythrobacter sp.]QIQ87971.1 MAG: hypothetical protein G9473_15665 [Erythrobacter sp.]